MSTADNVKSLELDLRELGQADARLQNQVDALTQTVRQLADHAGLTVDGLPDYRATPMVLVTTLANLVKVTLEADNEFRQWTADYLHHLTRVVASGSTKRSEPPSLSLAEVLGSLNLVPEVVINNEVIVPESGSRKKVTYDARGRIAEIVEEPIQVGGDAE